jgi:hypothetical protein
MASAEFVTEAQARELAREYGTSPDEIERETARDRSPPPTRPSRTPHGCTPSGPSRSRPPTGWLPTIMPGLSVTKIELGSHDQAPPTA